MATDECAMDSIASGVAWFDPELGMTIESATNFESKVVPIPPATPSESPAVAAMQSATIQIKGVLNVKLVSMAE